MEPRGTPTVAELTRHWSLTRPTTECVIDRGTGRRLTYAQLESRTNQTAAALAATGIGRGSVIALHSENRAEFIEVLLAAAKLGAVVVPLNIRLTSHELEQMMQICAPDLIVGGESVVADTSSVAKQADVRYLGIADELQNLSDREPDHARQIAAASTDPFLVLFTSGSTGRPKGAISTHANHYANFINVSYEYFEFQPGDIALNVAPMFFSASLGGTVLPFLMGGLTTVIEPRVDFGNIIEAIAAEKCTCTQLVPLVIYRLLEDIDRARDEVATLRRLGYGSAPIPPARLADAISAMGRSIFVQGYGATETVFATALQPTDHDPDNPELLASCGRPVLSARVRLRALDGSDGPVNPGEEGEVLISGGAVSPGYWQDTDATEASYCGDWFCTGDIARVDKDGYYYVVDRIKDLVISGGMNIYPREVENVIAKHADVADVAVIGVPDEQWGESVKAFVVPRFQAQLTGESIIDLCREQLASYKKPRTVEIVPDLPRTATGKVDKVALRSQFWPENSRQV
jgi:acyl-CoA synthetase (AMP-forming)/AMP-acid ligase II